VRARSKRSSKTAEGHAGWGRRWSTLLPTLGVKVPHLVTPELLESTFPVDVPDFQVDLAIALRDGEGRAVSWCSSKFSS